MVKITSIHTLIVVAYVFQWHVSQMDVKNIFLNGNIQEEVHKKPPLDVYL